MNYVQSLVFTELTEFEEIIVRFKNYTLADSRDILIY